KVKSVRLVQGQAEVSMDIESDQKVPTASKATIRPKTLFGEKFVDIDPGAAETSGPFLADHGRIKDTVGGFELERVLADAYPILKAIKPEDLLVVLDTLAQAAQGEGPAINRQIGNFQKVADHRAQIGPLVIGLREYFEIQAEAVRIPFGDGTMLAAIKLVFGEDCASGRNLDTGGCLAASSPGPSAGAGSSGQAGVGGANQTAVTLPPVTVPVPPLSGSKAV